MGYIVTTQLPVFRGWAGTKGRVSLHHGSKGLGQGCGGALGCPVHRRDLQGRRKTQPTI